MLRALMHGERRVLADKDTERTIGLDIQSLALPDTKGRLGDGVPVELKNYDASGHGEYQEFNQDPGNHQTLFQTVWRFENAMYRILEQRWPGCVVEPVHVLVRSPRVSSQMSDTQEAFILASAPVGRDLKRLRDAVALTEKFDGVYTAGYAQDVLNCRLGNWKDAWEGKTHQAIQMIKAAKVTLVAIKGGPASDWKRERLRSEFCRDYPTCVLQEVETLEEFETWLIGTFGNRTHSQSRYLTPFPRLLDCQQRARRGETTIQIGLDRVPLAYCVETVEQKEAQSSALHEQNWGLHRSQSSDRSQSLC